MKQTVCSAKQRRAVGARGVAVSILLGVIIMLALFGCGKQKYKLVFDGYGFESKKTVYAAGDAVCVYYGMVATDTDYSFWIDDDVKMSQTYDNDHGYVFSFAMPAHDVTLHVSSRNSMVFTEPDSIRVTLVNRVETADVWIVPQTEENLSSSLWSRGREFKSRHSDHVLAVKFVDT